MISFLAQRERCLRRAAPTPLLKFKEENSGGAMALLHPHRSDRYEAKRTSQAIAIKWFS
ncbi:MAG: hypothetical protein ACYTXA_00825 [Nostoc sp.]